MKVMGVNLSHDGSVCVIEDGEIVYYQEEERVTHEKHTTGILNSFSEAMRLHDPHEIVFVGAFPYELDASEVFASLMLGAGKYKHFIGIPDYNVHWLRDHHLAHAYVAYYNSGFEDAGILVVDGAGQAFTDKANLYRESETIYATSPRWGIQTKHKNLITQMSAFDYGKMSVERSTLSYFRNCTEKLPTDYPYTIYPSNLSLGKMFSAAGIKIFNSYHNAGKVMGLSAYGTDNPDHPRAFEDGRANPEILESDISDEDLAYRVQHDSLPMSVDLIRKTVEMSGSNNICLSGGYFLNCVNNYKYLKEFPDINFYVEPNSADSGTAIGAAMWLYKKLAGKAPSRSDNMYLGKQADYSAHLLRNEKAIRATPFYIAELLADKNVVALYQGKEESGPRALGNRSILYDPRDLNGRDTVNTIKKREYFRPFAGSVLEEEARHWFDMAGMKESRHMMYAVQTWPDKQDLVPALQHNDGTSRIQTVSYDDNPDYYEIIRAFFKLTGVPMILNTSFNLAGDTLVHTMEDALRTCRESGIKYLYCPEIGKLFLL